MRRAEARGAGGVALEMEARLRSVREQCSSGGSGRDEAEGLVSKIAVAQTKYAPRRNLQALSRAHQLGAVRSRCVAR